MYFYETIDLHPETNSGESSDATIRFEDRNLTLEIESSGYGNHYSKTLISMNPESMLKFSQALKEAAENAQAYFEKNP